MRRLWTILMMLGVSAQLAGADVWEDLAAFTSGDSQDIPPVKVEALIVNTPAGELGPLEDKLIAIVAGTNATQEAKWFACRMLQRIGTEKCVPTLGGLLCDERLSHYARLTLERLAGSKAAEKALVDALAKAPDALKPGILGSLGARGDAEALTSIAAYASHTNAAVAKAALQALGKIGGPAAATAIAKTAVCEEAANARLDAMLIVAEGMRDTTTLEQIYRTAPTDPHRAAALKGWVIADEAKAAPMVVELIKGEDSYLRDAALTILTREGTQRLTMAVAGSLADVPAALLPQVMGVLAERGDRSAVDAVQALITSDDSTVSTAAIRAAAWLGDAATVGALLPFAKGDKGEVVIDAIAAMTLPGVNAALIEALKNEAVAGAACRTLARREATEAVPAIKALAAAGNADARQAAWEALGELATEADLDDLMKMAVAIEDGALKRGARKSLTSIFARSPDQAAGIDIVGAYYDQGDEDTKGFILELAALGGSPGGLVYARRALQSGNPQLYDKAVRALAAWSQPQQACTDLLEVARTAPDEKNRIVALRGFITQGAKEGHKEKRLELLNAAAALVQRPDEKRMIIAAADEARVAMFAPLVLAYVDDPDVTAEARLALLNAAEALAEKDAAPAGVVEALSGMVDDPASDRKLVKRAKAQLERLKPVPAPEPAPAAAGDENTPQPTLGKKPPKGAVVLFDGANTDAWCHMPGQKPCRWTLEDGAMTVTKGGGNLFSKQVFKGNHQIHLEFRTPNQPDQQGQKRGNSGVYIQGMYEVQILDSYGLKGLDNECGAIYKVAAPRVNMCAPPLQWQSYDIDFTAPTFDAAGKKLTPAHVTVRHNGVLIHENQEIPGPTGASASRDEAHPVGLYLQDHGNPVSYRNIWVVELSN